MREVIGLQLFLFQANLPSKKQCKYTKVVTSKCPLGVKLEERHYSYQKNLKNHKSHMIFLCAFKQELCGSGKGNTDLSLLFSPASVLPQALSENESVGLIQTSAHISPHYKTPENLAWSAVSAQERPRTAIAEVLEIRIWECWLSYMEKQNTWSPAFTGTVFTCTK